MNRREDLVRNEGPARRTLISGWPKTAVGEARMTSHLRRKLSGLVWMSE